MDEWERMSPPWRSMALAVPPGSTLHDFVHDSLNREYLYVEGKLPDALAVLLHPFGGSPANTLAQYRAVADRGFSVLLPAGIANSWNAGACCGEAVKRKLDDAGFIRELVRDTLKRKFSDQPDMKVFVAGYSNGAFMTSKLALTAISNKDKFIQAIAMVSGYSYDDTLYRAALEQADKVPISILALHGTDDKAVRLEGCCKRGDCCCEIYSDECTSFKGSFDSWAEIYSCSANRKSMVVPSAFLDFKGEANCFAGNQCAASIKFCEFPRAGHSLQQHAPVGKMVAQFFYDEYTARQEQHALPAGSDQNMQHEPHDGQPEPSTKSASTSSPVVIVGLLIIIAILAFYTYKRKRANDRRARASDHEVEVQALNAA